MSASTARLWLDSGQYPRNQSNLFLLMVKCIYCCQHCASTGRCYYHSWVYWSATCRRFATKFGDFESGGLPQLWKSNIIFDKSPGEQAVTRCFESNAAWNTDLGVSTSRLLLKASSAVPANTTCTFSFSLWYNATPQVWNWYAAIIMNVVVSILNHGSCVLKVWIDCRLPLSSKFLLLILFRLWQECRWIRQQRLLINLFSSFFCNMTCFAKARWVFCSTILCVDSSLWQFTPLSIRSSTFIVAKIAQSSSFPSRDDSVQVPGFVVPAWGYNCMSVMSGKNFYSLKKNENVV